MKICVTGGAGFIGSHVAELFVSAGHEVVVVDNFSTGREENVPEGARVERMDVATDDIHEFFARERFDAVNHHAGQIELRTSVLKPIYDAQVNVVGSVRVIDASHHSGVKHFITASSAGGVYGLQENFPATENDEPHPISPYGVAKAAMELYTKYYASISKMKCVSLRYTNVYGPRQNPFGEAGVIGIVLERWLSGREALVHGDGEQRRDYIHVTDVAKANLLIWEHQLEGVYNVCANVETSVNELINQMREALPGVPSPVNYGPEKIGDPQRGVASYAKLQAATGWTPTIAVESGVPETAEWFKNLHK